MPHKRKTITSAELYTELKTKAPEGTRGLLVHEDLINSLINTRGHRVLMDIRNPRYSFRNMSDARSKLFFLEQAWNNFVRITLRELDDTHMEATFRLVD